MLSNHKELMSDLESHEKTATRRLSRIARRTRGQSQGPITRLMSPSDFGRLLKPFVFLDLIDNQGKPFSGFGLHPHSGIATLTYIAEGSVSYEDTNGATGLLAAGGVEWMRAGGGVWHGGGTGKPGRTRGFQLWVALPRTLVLWTRRRASIWFRTSYFPHGGACHPGSHGDCGKFDAQSDAPMNYLAVPHEGWMTCLGLPAPAYEHTGALEPRRDGLRSRSRRVATGRLVAFTPSSAEIELEAQSDAEFVLGSAVPHDYEPCLGSYSVHTIAEALRKVEARILEIQTRLSSAGQALNNRWSPSRRIDFC